MKARLARKRANPFGKNAPRRLWFERLESRQLLSAAGFPGSGAVVDVIPAGEASAGTVAIRLQATDTCGRPIDRVSVGDQFWLEAYVQDLRFVPKGVFAAYLDVGYDAALVATATDEYDGFVYGSSYENGQSGQFAPGLIDEAGGFAGLTELLGGEHLLMAVPFTATAAGVADFAGSPAAATGHDVLIYGNDFRVPWDEIRMLGTQVIVEVDSPESPGLVAGGVLDSSLNLACGGAMIAGSGAELASTQTPRSPREYYDWTYDDLPGPADPSWTRERSWDLADASAVTEAGSDDRSANRSYLDGSPDWSFVVTKLQITGDDADHTLPWSWPLAVGDLDTEGWWYDDSFSPVIYVLSSPDYGAATSLGFTISFSEAGEVDWDATSLPAFFGGVPVASPIVPVDLPLGERSDSSALRTARAWNDGSSLSEPGTNAADDRWLLRWGKPAESGADAIGNAARGTMPLDGFRVLAGRAGDPRDSDPVLTWLTKGRQAQRAPRDLQLLDALFEGVALRDGV